MTDRPIDLDEHRNSKDLIDADSRRRRLYLSHQQEKLDHLCFSNEAKTWPEAAEKALHVINLFAETKEGRTPYNVRLINHVICEIKKLQIEEYEK